MYVVTLGIGVAVHRLATPNVDPILAFMVILTLPLLSALAVVLLMVAIVPRRWR